MSAGSPDGTPSVLLVDDVPANLLALSAVLRPLGARLVEARSGEAVDGLSVETVRAGQLFCTRPSSLH